ncbi:MAG: hypothetical protein NT150_09760 [Bacteroidetes bacterium]|nr:hypothetical protein [Bacteroidota bacterium]
MKNKVLYFCLLALPALVLFFSMSTNSDQKSNPKKQWKMISSHQWKIKDMVKNGKTVDIVKYTGDQFYSFFTEKAGKKKINKVKIEIGAEVRLFECGIVGDSIKLYNASGWNNYKIISLQKDKAVLEQVSLGTNVQWNLVPR